MPILKRDLEKNKSGGYRLDGISEKNLMKCYKALKIIIKKEVPIVYIKFFDNVIDYNNHFIFPRPELTEKEFNLLKEALKWF